MHILRFVIAVLSPFFSFLFFSFKKTKKRKEKKILKRKEKRKEQTSFNSHNINQALLQLLMSSLNYYWHISTLPFALLPSLFSFIFVFAILQSYLCIQTQFCAFTRFSSNFIFPVV